MSDRPNRTGPSRAPQGPRALAQALDSVTHPILAVRGLAAGRLIADWAMIVGPLLARNALPERVSRDRHSTDSTLVLRVRPAAAIEIQHWLPLLIDRINQHFGFRAITRIRLVQATLPFAEPDKLPQPRTLSAAEEAWLVERLADITDDGLKQALAALGRSLLERSPADPDRHPLYAP